MTKKLKNFIDGAWITSESNDFIEVKNPAFDETIALHPKSSEQEVNAAVAASKASFGNWSSTPAVKRAATMYQFRDKLLERKQRIAETMVEEHGKTYPEAVGEFTRALECVEYVCGSPELSKGAYSENVGGGIDLYYVLEPVGAFALLPPFNFPALLSCYFCWPVALGNTVVIKPPDLCPNTVIQIVEAAQECDIPPGVINLVCGSAEVGQLLSTHPDIAGVTFIGSSKVGELVYKAATGTGKRAQIQGGAKNHIVVASDCNLDDNIKAMVNAAFGSASQRCFAASNFLVDESIYDQFLEMFLKETRKLKLGYGMDKGADIGPLVSKTSLENALNFVGRAEREGAKIILDGRDVSVEGYPNGYFMAPTLLEANYNMEIWKEEVFAPVRCVKSFGKISEALTIINNSDYGHSAVIFTENGGTARAFIRNCNVGHVGINVGTPVPLSFMSVGGRKKSFYGDLRGQGTDAVNFCTDKKFIAQRWSTSLES